MVDRDKYGVQRRVIGEHHFRLDGLNDLMLRAPGASVLSLGCNRGNECLKMADWGAAVVHGCDNHDRGILACREFFADLRSIDSLFQQVDLSQGVKALEAFGDRKYDIVLMLATYHKLKRVMAADHLSAMMKEVGRRTLKYFAWRGTKDQHAENDAEIMQLDTDLGAAGLKRIHTSYISTELGSDRHMGEVMPKYMEPLQNREEFTRFVDILLAEDVRSYLEIGSKWGGTLWWVASALRAKLCRLTAVDLPEGDRKTLPHLQQCVEAVRKLGHDVELIIGDSTDLDVVAAVRERGPYDVVFIDANHTLPYVLQDWGNYSQVARIVAFHDIGWRVKANRKSKVPIEVPLLWSEIKAQGWRTQEIRLEPSDNGIGVVWMA